MAREQLAVPIRELPGPEDANKLYPTKAIRSIVQPFRFSGSQILQSHCTSCTNFIGPFILF